MIVGLIADAKHSGISEEIQLWAMKRALRERGVMSVVMQYPETTGRVSDFILDRFTLCTASRDMLKSYGINRQIGAWMTSDKETVQAYRDENVLFIPDALILVPQMCYHAISVKPDTEVHYLFVDIKEWNAQKVEAVKKIADESGCVLVMNEAGAVPEEIGALEIKCRGSFGTGEYLGYIWKSDAVITDSYVGSVMSALHEKAFAMLPAADEDEESRTEDILQRLCLEGRIYKSGLPDYEQMKRQEGLTEFRKAVGRMRKRMLAQMEEHIAGGDAEVVVKCPVKLPLSLCCACGACEASCPEHAIHMEMNENGFYYPVVDNTLCNDCGWCADRCIKKQKSQVVRYEDASFPEIYVGEVPDGEGRYTAYSGLFREIARYVVTQKEGIIFGTVLSEKQKPVLISTRDWERAGDFAQQRCLMSHTTDGFRQIRELLEQGQFVMFAGLPCECAALRAFLKKKYAKLFVCEFMCHYTVSEKAFESYVRALERGAKSPVKSICFGRYPAETMAKSRVLVIEYENGKLVRQPYRSNRYLKLIHRLSLVNEACAYCSYSGKKRVGDLTLGELRKTGQGDVPAAWRNKSMLVISTDKGRRVLAGISGFASCERTDYDTVLNYQHRNTVSLPKERGEMLKLLKKSGITAVMRRYAKE